MQSNPIRLDIKEMAKMYNYIVNTKKENIDAILYEYSNLDDYINRTLNRLAKDSHSDVILMNHDVELRKVTATYPEID